MRIKIILIIIFLFVIGVDRVLAVPATCGGANAETTTSVKLSEAQLATQRAEENARLTKEAEDRAAANLAATNAQISANNVDAAIATVLREQANLDLLASMKKTQDAFTVLETNKTVESQIETVYYNEQALIAQAAAQAAQAQVQVQYYNSDPYTSPCSGSPDKIISPF